jgi:protein-disulfide isomerase
MKNMNPETPQTDPVFHQYLATIIGAVIIAGAIFMAADKIGSVKPTSPNGTQVAVDTGKNNPTPNNPSDQPTPTNSNPQPATGPADMSGVTLEHVLGKADAPVTMIEFSDLQCPFCERLYQQVEKPLITDYVNTGKVKLVFKPYAFLGPDSVTAAEGLYCAADQNKYWEYHNYLFDHQGQENSGWANKENIKKMAKAIGLNTSKFNDCLDKETYKDKVNKDLQEGQKVGVNGTPASFINGESIPGAQPYATFKDLIEKKLSGK